MIKLRNGGLKTLKAIHMILMSMWVGGAFGMNLLLFACVPANGEEMFMRAKYLKVIDDMLVIPGAIGCLVTGLLFGIFTKWGFFKHGWLTAKWILTVTMILVGTFALGPRVNGNVVADNPAFYVITNAEYWNNVHVNEIIGLAQLLGILVVVIISVAKPHKKQL